MLKERKKIAKEILQRYQLVIPYLLLSLSSINSNPINHLFPFLILFLGMVIRNGSWKIRERVLESEGNKFLEPTIFSSLKIIPEKITITAPKESNN